MEWNANLIEEKWKKIWLETGLYTVSNDSPLPKYYVLDMFPYPSGAGLHVGHPLGYIASDIFSRFKRLNGYNVLHPMGYDAFGLPAEQYAIQTGVHPAISTNTNINQFRKQLDNLGFSYDWSREIRTSDPTYYKWTQWIFIKLFGHYYDLDENKAIPINNLTQKFESGGSNGANAVHTPHQQFSADEWNQMKISEKEDILMNYRLMYRKTGVVNWCEALGTVLANDEVKDGLSERGGYPVIKKPMMQWSMRTTAYAERLLSGLDKVNWPESLKLMQRNWIGKSTGASINFEIADHDMQLEIFTTRPDTIFGATFMVIAPQHPLAEKISSREQNESVTNYIQQSINSNKNNDEDNDKPMSGVFTGSFAINPFSQKKLPIWVSDYVLMEYGTGAIMAVPGGDLRDKRFADSFGLPIIEIIDQSGLDNPGIEAKAGVMINSGFLNGMEVNVAIAYVIDKIEQEKIGHGQINYKLKDANYSRQRYWGEPFPITYNASGVPETIKEDQLPLTLPDVTDFKPTGDGSSPLAKASEWLITEDEVIRETDTMPGFAGSSWYYLRYMDPQNDKALVSNEAINYWQNVDVYIGGAEHAVGHLLYSRMWHKFLFDIGVTVTVEPFERLINQGMIQGVSEKTYLLKELTNKIFFINDDKSWEELTLEKRAQVFLSKELIEVYSSIFRDRIKEKIEISEMPVNIDFITDYGNSSGGYLSKSGLDSFIEWRPDFKEAVFVTAGGYYINGQFYDITGKQSDKFFTHSEVEKMSKSKYNVISPDDVSDKYGADVFRMYEMFLGPIEQSKPWNTSGIEGVSKFAKRFWSLFFDADGNKIPYIGDQNKDDLKIVNKTIKKITEDIEKFSFNTCISAFMIAVNDLKNSKSLNFTLLEPLVICIAPFAPFMSEELWSLAGKEGSVHSASWPKYDESLTKDDTITYPVCINGKKRDLVEMAADATEDQIKAAALASADIQKWLEDVTPKKIIFIPGKMVNIVI